MKESLDNSNGIQYYGGNDPAKMSGRFKKGGGRGVTESKAKSKGARLSKDLRSISPDAPISARIAARTTTASQETKSKGARLSKDLRSISPDAPVSSRIAARTKIDLGAPRVSSSAGLQR